MGKIYSHMGIDVDKLDQKTYLVLDNGEEITYNTNYNESLVVNMAYMGKENNKKSSVNACGWKRDSKYYFKKLLNEHPEFFSEENKWSIEDGLSPICDKIFIGFFPEYKGFLGDKLIHHHIGEDGQAVALPAGLHTGYGIVHNVEKGLGVTENGHNFSKIIECDYKKGKKFEWKYADQVMGKVIIENSVNNANDSPQNKAKKSPKEEIKQNIFMNPKRIEVFKRKVKELFKVSLEIAIDKVIEITIDKAIEKVENKFYAFIYKHTRIDLDDINECTEPKQGKRPSNVKEKKDKDKIIKPSNIEKKEKPSSKMNKEDSEELKVEPKNRNTADLKLEEIGRDGHTRKIRNGRTIQVKPSPKAKYYVKKNNAEKGK